MNRRNVLQAAAVAPVAALLPVPAARPSIGITITAGRIPRDQLEKLFVWMHEHVHATLDEAMSDLIFDFPTETRIEFQT